jgi:putative FmdB family regulatory protein
MPIYEFRCARCGEEFEALLPIGSAAPRCPSCGAERSERLISRIAGRVVAGAACACGGSCSCSAN